MTDRYFALTVLLVKDTRSDDAEPVIEAIKMIKGVANVVPHVVSPDLWCAEERARLELAQKLWKVLHPKDE